jgi:hypothetical protein
MSEGASKKPLFSGVAVAGVIACALVLAFAIGFPLSLYSYCSALSENEQPIPQHVTVDREDTKTGGGYAEQPPITQFSFGERLLAPIQQQTRTQTTYYAASEPYRWGRQFWCEVNASDYFIALFTLVLAAVTGFLWWSTHKLWKAGEQQLTVVQASVDAVKLTEMARVMVTKVWLPDIAQGKKSPKFQVYFQNYGKTPGFIHRTTLHFAPAIKGTTLESIVSGARGGSYDNGFLLPPTKEDKRATDQYGAEFITAEEFAALTAQKTDLQLFVWGDVRFSPVFGETWVSGFAYRINLTPNRNQKNVEVGGAEHWRFYKADQN